MSLARISALFCALSLLGVQAGAAQDTTPQAANSADVISQLTDQLRAQEARLKELEAEVSQLKQAQANPPPPASGAEPTSGTEPVAPPPAEAPPVPVMQQEEGGGHNMSQRVRELRPSAHPTPHGLSGGRV
jgi:hypothetical protein